MTSTLETLEQKLARHQLTEKTEYPPTWKAFYMCDDPDEDVIGMDYEDLTDAPKGKKSFLSRDLKQMKEDLQAYEACQKGSSIFLPQATVIIAGKKICTGEKIVPDSLRPMLLVIFADLGRKERPSRLLSSRSIARISTNSLTMGSVFWVVVVLRSTFARNSGSESPPSIGLCLARNGMDTIPNIFGTKQRFHLPFFERR